MRRAPWQARRRVSRSWNGVSLIALACVGCAGTKAAPLPSSARPASEQRSDASERRRVSVTVYNSSFALVREERRVRLGVGRVALAFEDVSAHVQPESVALRALDPDGSVGVLEQNYRYDLLTPENLLAKYVGRRVRIARYSERLGRDEVREAEVLATEGGPVLRVDGQVVPATGERFLFPELPPDLLPKPTLVWLLDSEAAEPTLEVSYLTRNLSWHADYVLTLAPNEREAELGGWVTLANQSGASYAAAELTLVAGDVQRIAPPPPPPPMPAAPDMDVMTAAAAAPQFEQKALFEYHAYTLQRPTDLLDREQKQVRLLEAPRVAVRRKLVLHGNPELYRTYVGDAPHSERASVYLELDNDEANGLGSPLPAGVVRVYAAGSDGTQRLLGEDSIDHTPRDERVELGLGRTFDVTAERRQRQLTALGPCSAESDWELRVQNRRANAERVEIIEHASGEWSVVQSSAPPKPRDAQSFAFELDVPGGGVAQLEYRLRVRWC